MNPALAAPAVEVDLGAIDTLPPAKGGSAGSPIELTPPASIRAKIARQEAAKRAADQRAAEARKRSETAQKAEASRRAAEENKRSAAARRAEEARRSAGASRKAAEQRRMAADEKARRAAEARATAQPKELRKSANKSERVAPPAAKEPVANNPAPQAASKPSASGKTRLMFAKGSSQLTSAARRNLTPVVQSLSGNAGNRLVIYAYAGGEKARRLSLSRALAVRLYLIKAGIQGTRTEVRAQGSSTTEKPVDRVDLELVGQ